MSTLNIQFHNKIRTVLLIFVSLSYLRVSYGLKNEFELAMVNEPSVFKLLRFYCTVNILFSETRECYRLKHKTKPNKKHQASVKLAWDSQLPNQHST